MASSGAAAPTPPRPLRVAFVGNSYIYFNDLPRLFQALCESDQRSLALQQAQPQQRGDAGAARPACPATAEAAVVGSCLRGGVSLKTVLAKGGEMSDIFATPNAIRADGWSHDVGAATVAELLLHPSQPCWDAIVMNDYSQAPCRPDTLADGLALMREQVASLLRSVTVRRGTTGCSHGGDGASGGGDGGRGRGACVGVLLAPPAYREPRKGSGDIGTWAEFTAKVAAGYEAYRLALVDALKRASLGARGGGGGAGGGGGGSNTSSGRDGTAADCGGRGSGRSGATSAESAVASTSVVNNGAGGGGPNSVGGRDDVGGGGDDGDAAVVVADANGAFALVRGEDEALWRDLFYSGDGYHPSPLGSFLEACCVFCAVRRRAPRVDAQTQRAPFSLWGRARFMLPDGAVERMPTAKEMLYLAEVAARATLLPPPKPRAAAVASQVAE